MQFIFQVVFSWPTPDSSSFLLAIVQVMLTFCVGDVNSVCYPSWRALVVPQTGLALMGFSRYCPSSLDLTNFVVRECRGATAEECSSRSKFQKVKNLKDLKIQIRSAQNVSKVWISRKKSSWPHLGPSGPIFPWTGKTQKDH